MKSIKVKEEIKSDSSPLPSEKSDEDDDKVCILAERQLLMWKGKLNFRNGTFRGFGGCNVDLFLDHNYAIYIYMRRISGPFFKLLLTKWAISFKF